MLIITLLAQKGGCGKTTISVNLAAALAARHPHLKVGVADADPQGSSTVWINRGKGAAGISVHPVASDGVGKALRPEIEALGLDVVVIDLPPALETIALRSAILADLMLIPSNPSVVDLSATKSAIDIAKESIELNPKKRYLLIPNRVQNNTAVGRELRSVLANWGPVSKTTLCQRIAFSEAAVHGLGVSQYAPESPAALEIGQLAEEVTSILSIQ